MQWYPVFDQFKVKWMHHCGILPNPVYWFAYNFDDTGSETKQLVARWKWRPKTGRFWPGQVIREPQQSVYAPGGDEVRSPAVPERVLSGPWSQVSRSGAFWDAWAKFESLCFLVCLLVCLFCFVFLKCCISPQWKQNSLSGLSEFSPLTSSWRLRRIIFTIAIMECQWIWLLWLTARCSGPRWS